MNSFDLALAKYIQEFSPVPIRTVENHFNKTKSTIARSISKLNQWVEIDDFISFDKQNITTNFSYSGYTKLLNQLPLSHYHSNTSERIKALLVEMALTETVNKKQFYTLFNVSDTTLKNDRKHILSTLECLGLVNETVVKKGTRLTGEEAKIRIHTARTVLNTLELDKDNLLIEHLSNTPVNKLIASHFLSYCHDYLVTSAAMYNQLEQQYRVRLSYNSKKFLIIYFSLTLLRGRQGRRLSALDIDDWLSNQYFKVFDNHEENLLASRILASMTFYSGKYNCYDPRLTPQIENFTQKLCGSIRTHIHNRNDFFADLYSVIKSCLTQAKLNISFPDKKLSKVKERHQFVYQLVEKYIADVERSVGLVLSENHLATITMVIKKYVVQNKAIDRERARIYLVSNSSHNKLGYFIEKLKTHFHIDIKGIVNSNEIIHIPEDQYDVLITFTNKISRYLSFHGKTSVKVDFQLGESDLRALKQLGLSRSARKIPVDQFIAQIQQLSPHELNHLLKTQYKEHFI
ncbi:PRD domain-containing protein [Photobacterium sp. DA100]|uniref:PRD domain-containing protein n=1 Tax=Photobacterium sp. DA100 TaxID=3027472 RepID=UPI00247A574A|nr:PRD domain-containing protein [Photobacterium sp. DA100]WEM43063.1 PRD domain-containing protein [Photobacterium sp. DA100]